MKNGSVSIQRYSKSGAPDTSFGTAGTVNLTFANPINNAELLPMPGNNILVSASDGNTSFLWMLDNSGGKAKSFASGHSIPVGYGIVGLALSPSGKIDAGGNENGHFAAQQFLSSGIADQTFYHGHAVVTDLPGDVEHGNAIAVQSDGKILLAGQGYVFAYGSHQQGFAVVRYTTSGQLDKSFGTNGETALAPAYSFAGEADSMLVLKNGEILVAGSDDGARIVRLHSNGSIDTGFGNGGSFRATLSSQQNVTFNLNGIGLQSDGKIIATFPQETDLTHPSVGLFRLTTSGKLDTSFGSNGIASASVYQSASFQGAISVDSSGNILVAGGATGGDFQDFVPYIVRFKSNGQLDSTFGQSGRIAYDTSALDGSLGQLLVQSNGKIIAVGYTDTPIGTSGAYLARYNTDGSLDTTFGSHGRVFFSSIVSFTRRTDGSIIVLGNNSTNNGIVVARFSSSGKPDTTFGTNGELTFKIPSRYSPLATAGADEIWAMPDGHILVSGGFVVENSQPTDFLLRITSAGKVDTTFGQAGMILTGESEPVPVQDGRIYLFSDNQISRLLLSGAPDPSFGTPSDPSPTPKPLDNRADFFAFQPDGKIVLVNSVSLAGYPNDSGEVVLSRYTSDGVLDPTFGVNGQAQVPLPPSDQFIEDLADRIVLAPDGSIIVLGGSAVAPNGNDGSILLEKFSADGVPDLSFGDNGRFLMTFVNGESSGIYSGAVLPDGNILISGTTTAPETPGNFSGLVRPVLSEIIDPA